MKHLFSGLLLAFMPGILLAQKYWQQEVNYQIQVTLNDVSHELTGTETIEYINNSPDQLTFIYFHLWPNAYKNTQTALARQMLVNSSRKFHFASPENRGYIDGLNFEVNGKPARLEYEQEDVAKLMLNEPLKPGGRLQIKTPFHVKIPGAFSRLGHVEQSYQISQWYPKPAVYDQRGWHPMPYLDQGEFYSEFGKFDVKITLPANYTVGATGVLQTASEISRLDTLAAIGAAKKEFGNDNTIPPSAAQTKTLHYIQDNVHDFAWFADKRFNVLKSEVELPVSKRKVTTWLMFLNRNAEGWLKRKNDINDAIYYYSLYVGEYPYAAATAVDGALGENAGGMEYPMVTVTVPSAIVHEVGHNWFYGILASNERDHVWLDEGVNTYIESRIAEKDDPKAGQFSSILKSNRAKQFGLENLDATPMNLLMYQLAASRGADQPIQYPAAHYSSLNYGGIVYMKSAVVLKYLAAYLGQEKFDAAMHAYFEKWKFKHPYPEDMEAVFEQSTGENLDWFFQHIIKTTKPVNVEISSFQKTGAGTEVTIKNESGYPVPVPVAALDEAGRILELHWVKPFSETGKATFTVPEPHRYVIDPEYLLPELNRRDNQLKTSGLFPKSEKLHLQKLLGIEQNDKTQLYYVPVIGANTSDKFMLGMAFYNSSLIAKKVNYLVMPMYSFNRNEVNGIANVNFNLVPRNNRAIRQAVLGLNFQRFEVFEKYQPSVAFNFQRKTTSAPRQQLRLSSTFILQHPEVKIYRTIDGERYFMYSLNPLSYPAEYYRGHTIDYTIDRKNALQEVGLWVQYQLLESTSGNSFIRTALTFERYWSKSKSFNARLFSGRLFGNGPAVLGLSSSPDYLRETTFLDRQQISKNYRAQIDQTDNGDGAFRNYLPVYTQNWLTTLNLTTELPALPLSAYLDLGKVADINKVFYGTGLQLTIANGAFSLYFPVAGSNYSNSIPENFKDFRQNIRFNLDLNKLNPFKLLNESL